SKFQVFKVLELKSQRLRLEVETLKLCHLEALLLSGQPANCMPGPAMVPAFFSALLLLARSWRGDPEKDQSCAIQPNHIFVGKPTHTRADSQLRNGRDLIHHKPANSPQPIALARLHHKAKQWSFTLIGGKWTNGDRVSTVESVVLNNHNRTRLPRVVFTACDSPNFTALHLAGFHLDESDVPPQSEIASMKSWSARARGLLATATD